MIIFCFCVDARYDGMSVVKGYLEMWCFSTFFNVGI